MELTTLTMETLYVSVSNDNSTIFINDAEVVISDLVGSNGVIHGINQVLVSGYVPPPTSMPSTNPSATPTVTMMPSVSSSGGAIVGVRLCSFEQLLVAATVVAILII
jgi:hypothetical protein